MISQNLSLKVCILLPSFVSIWVYITEFIALFCRVWKTGVIELVLVYEIPIAFSFSAQSNTSQNIIGIHIH